MVKGFLCFSLYFTYPSKPLSTALNHKPHLKFLSTPLVMMFPVAGILERMFFSPATAETNYLLGVGDCLSVC